MEVVLKIKSVYITNIVFACIYFIIISLSTLVAALFENINTNNIELRTILCFIYSAFMLFITLENFKNQESFYNEKIKSIFLKIAIILYYIYIVFSSLFYIYETFYITKKIGSYNMALGALIILYGINNTIKKKDVIKLS